MTQIKPRDLDYSEEMRSYFHKVAEFLVERHHKSIDEARELVGRYFALEVDPLERAFLMHTEAAHVAAELAMGEAERRRLF